MISSAERTARTRTHLDKTFIRREGKWRPKTWVFGQHWTGTSDDVAVVVFGRIMNLRVLRHDEIRDCRMA